MSRPAPMTPGQVLQSYLQAMHPYMQYFQGLLGGGGGAGAPQQPQPQAEAAPTVEAKPPTYDEAIPEGKMADYEKWRSQLPKELQSDRDYDLRGAFMGGAEPRGGHLTDEWKKPWHMTFSTESKYSSEGGELGGVWKQTGKTKSGKPMWTFTASPTNLKYHSAEELKEYFKKHETESKLILPKEGQQ